MADIRGVIGPLVDGTSVDWATIAVVGDLGVLWDAVGARPEGWDAITGETLAFSKRLAAADLATPLAVKGHISAAFALSAAGGVGNVRKSEWARVPAGGVAIWLGWKTPWSSSALAASTYQYGSTVTASDDGYRHAVWARAVTTADDYSPGSVHDRTHMVSIVVPPLAAPLAPVWVAPASGTAVDRAAAASVTVAHQSAANATQDKLRVEIRVAAGTWQHVAADGTIGASPVELVQAGGTVQIAANQLTANTTYELRAMTHDDGGWSPYGASLTLVARTVPTVVVTLTTAAGDLSPTVSWTTTPGVGSQTSLEARISPAGAGPDAPVLLWQSGLQAGADTSWQAPASTEPTNGGSYVAWVRVTDAALRSAWTASTAQTVSWTAPDAPASVVATDGTPPSVTVSGVPATAVALEWEWLIAAVWTALTTTEGPAATETIRVPQAPYEAGRTYRVRSYAVVDGVRLASAWVTSAEMTSTDRGAYLVGDDGAWLAVDVYDDGQRAVVQGVSVSYGLGATMARIDRTVVAGVRGSTSIDTETAAECAAVVDWLTTRDQWGTRWPVERDPSGAWTAVADTRMGLASPVGVSRWDQLAITERNVAFDWVTIQ